MGSIGDVTLALDTLDTNRKITMSFSAFILSPFAASFRSTKTHTNLNLPNGYPASSDYPFATISETGVPQSDADDQGLQALTGVELRFCPCGWADLPRSSVRQPADPAGPDVLP